MRALEETRVPAIILFNSHTQIFICVKTKNTVYVCPFQLATVITQKLSILFDSSLSAFAFPFHSCRNRYYSNKNFYGLFLLPTVHIKTNHINMSPYHTSQKIVALELSLEHLSQSNTHQSAITLKPLTCKTNNTDNLITVQTVKGWDL